MKDLFQYIHSSEGRKQFVLILCVSGFIGGLLISSITASKLHTVSVLGLELVIPVGTSLFAITFASTDVISEVWGKMYASMLVFAGFIARVATWAFLSYAVSIEGSGAPIWDNQEAYASVLSGSSRIVLAGILTYPVSQFVDIFLYEHFRERHKDKNMLWFRNNFSTFISQSVDSIVFIAIAFGGTVSMGILANIVMGQLVIKWLIALCDTPLVYFLRNIALKRKLFDFRG